MKEKDLQIVRHLRANSRETLTRLSRKTGVPISTLFDKLNQYKDQVILRNTCLIDYQRLGYDLRVQLLVKISKDRERFEQYITEHFHVNNVLKINNGYDYLIEAVFRNMKDFTDFVASFDRFAVKECKEYYILEDLKREAFLTTDSHVLLLQHP